MPVLIFSLLDDTNVHEPHVQSLQDISAYFMSCMDGCVCVSGCWCEQPANIPGQDRSADYYFKHNFFHFVVLISTCCRNVKLLGVIFFLSLLSVKIFSLCTTLKYLTFPDNVCSAINLLSIFYVHLCK